jgi:choline dehydrogenase-like flavoprotein
LLPYRLHVAIDYVAGCRECFGFRCALACKGDGYNRALERALASGLVRVETEHQVLRIEPPAAGRVSVVVATPVGRPGGDAAEGFTARTARQVVVAAGALNTPLLLERSSALWRDATPPVALGRGLMFHVSDLFILKDDKSHADGPQKWLGFRDFYDDGRVNLGEVQSLGIGVSTGTVIEAVRFHAARLLGTSVQPLTEFARPLAWLAARIIGPRAIYATITEDRPHLANRVSFEDGRIVTTYAADPALVAHARAMRGRLRAAFAPHRLRFISRPGTPNWGHPLGTCRMGNDPATSVVDADGRLHGHPEISVCDASVFPSSGGTGPSLTVIALALRVADRLAGELRAEASATSRKAVLSGFGASEARQMAVRSGRVK